MVTIRKKLLEELEHLGILGDASDTYLDSLMHQDIQKQLKVLNVHCDDEEQQLSTLKTSSRTGHLKFWHDHLCFWLSFLVIVGITCVWSSGILHIRWNESKRNKHQCSISGGTTRNPHLGMLRKEIHWRSKVHSLTAVEMVSKIST